MDTAKDFRIRLAERAIEECEKSLSNLKIQGRKEFVKNISKLKSDVQIIKYSYMPFEELAKFEITSKIRDVASKTFEIIKESERTFHYLNAKFWLDYLQNLPKLFMRGEINRAYEAIRFFSAEVISYKEIQSNLWLCGVDCSFKIEVVTNSVELAKKKKIVVSYLPPKQFGSFISEGMFVDAEFDKKGELNHDEILSIGNKLGEVEALILNLL